MGSPVFLYGELLHPPMLEIVAGSLHAQDLTPATLPGCRVEGAADSVLSLARPDDGSEMQGLLLSGADSIVRDRIDFYERAKGARLCPAKTVSGEEVTVYLCESGQRVSCKDWSLDDWVARWAELAAAAAQEIMGYHGTRPPDEVQKLMARIMARAQSAVNAKRGRHGAGTLEGRIDIEQRDRVHSEFFVFDKLALRHSTFDGGMSPVMHREVFLTSDAAIVLPYDAARDRVLLVEQVRMGPIARRDPVCWQLEPVAGLIDPGETPEETARREAEEEAGVEIGALHAVAEGYTSPGASTDFHFIYVGECDLPDDLERAGGNPEEGENIRLHLMAFADLLEMAEDRRTANTPLTLAAYWLARHRDRLRSPA